jgi:hypothetical protein
MITRDAASLRSSRALARAPRIAAVTACAVLAATGAKNLVTGAREAELRSAHAPAPPRDVEAEAFAESFARAYLEVDGTRDPRDLTVFGVDLEPPRQRSAADPQRVRWTAVSASRSRGATSSVTVAADTTRGPVHLAVAVGRTRDGRRFVAGPPAIVGPPAVDTAPRRLVRDEVGDPELDRVAARTLKNYLGRDRSDLLAVLAPDAKVVLPERTAKVTRTEPATWVAKPGRIAVGLDARTSDGLELTLQYELSVVRRSGRWLVRAVNTEPTPEVLP